MEHLILDSLANPSDFFENLSSSLQNAWHDTFLGYIPSTYDSDPATGIDVIQDRLALVHGKDSYFKSDMEMVDHFQYLLHHPELHPDVKDDTYKGYIRDILARWK